MRRHPSPFVQVSTPKIEQAFSMFVTFVDKRPDDFCNYVSLPEDLDEMEIEQRLISLLSQGTFNVHVPECFLETVAQPEVTAAAQKSNYRIFAKPLINKTSMAEFFFQCRTEHERAGRN